MIQAGVLGVDVGGTSIKAALLSPDGEQWGAWRRPTPRGDVTGLRTGLLLAELSATAAAVAPVAAMGIAVPGIVDEERELCSLSTNLGWRDLPLRTALASQIAVPVAFTQDVRAGGAAELALAPDPSAAFVPIGTGIGAAIRADGRPLVGGGWAGEIGHIRLASGTHRGMRLEEIASASAVARRVGVPDAKSAADLVRAGSAQACAVWAEAVDALADVLAVVGVATGLSLIVVGGGLALAGELLLGPLREGMEVRLDEPQRPRIASAVHGDRAAVLGAAMIARRLVRS